jgi:preprotein translocase subunit SecA
MRLFNSERIAKVMDRMGHKDGEVIQHSMVTKSIERAQKKVEENNFGIRKRLLEYDDVMNIQREAIYKKRDHALHGERLSVDLNNMFLALTETLAQDYKQMSDYDAFSTESLRVLGIPPKIEAVDFAEGNVEDIVDHYQEQVLSAYRDKADRIKQLLYPVVKSVYENEGHRYKRIAIPFTDGRKNPLAISADLQSAVESEGKTLMQEIEKAVTLSLIDQNWMEHLRYMDELKESVQSASFEQKDPLVIYKMEAYNLFEEYIYKVNEEVCSYLIKGRLLIGQGDQVQEARQEKTDMSKVSTSRSDNARQAAAAAAGRGQQKVETFKRTDKKVGRNDPCPCGSGKKYKHCHGR